MTATATHFVINTAGSNWWPCDGHGATEPSGVGGSVGGRVGGGGLGGSVGVGVGGLVGGSVGVTVVGS